MYFDSIALRFISKLTLILAVMVMLFVGMKAYESIHSSPEMKKIQEIMGNQNP